METYRCAYRDPLSPLTPLTPICDVTLTRTLRDHSPSLVPINTIVLADCPTPKRKRSTAPPTTNKSATKHRSCGINIVLSSAKTPEEERSAKKSSYLKNLRKILTPTSRHTPKSIDLTPTNGNGKLQTSPLSEKKRSRFTCFQGSPSDRPIPNSPRVLRLLQDIGLEKYSELFRKEEIDLDVFKMLTKGDLIQLGIKEENDISVLIKAARLVKNW